MKIKLILITLCILLISCTSGDNNKVMEQGEEEHIIETVEEKIPDIITKNEKMEENKNKESIFEKYEFTPEDYERFSINLKNKTIEGDKDFLSYTYGMNINDAFLKGSRSFLEMTKDTEFFYSCDKEEMKCTKGGKEGMIRGGTSHYYDKNLQMFFSKPFREETKVKENKLSYLELWRYNDEKDKKDVQVYINDIDLKTNTSYGQSIMQINQYIVKEEGNTLDLVINPINIEGENNTPNFTMSLTVRLLETNTKGEKISNEEILKLEFSEDDLIDGKMKKTIFLDTLLK